MSNLIKYPYANLADKEVFVIDSDARGNQFVSFRESETNLPPKRGQKVVPVNPVSAGSEEFTAGMNLINADEILVDEIKKNKEQAEKILEEARRRADELLVEAQNNVKKIYKDAYESGKIEGYSAGEVEARENILMLEEELNQKIEDQEAEYKNLLEEIEPKYVKVLISLLQKLTGVILEEQHDTLLFLIKQCMANLDKSSKYVIRIAKEDGYLIESQKEEIKAIVGEDATVEFWEEKSLKKNECIIETDLQMVDCGFQTQLTNLIETLKFLVS